MQKRNIPNILSVIRILLVPLFVTVFFWNYPVHVWHAILIFFTAGATDVADGWLARRYGWSSDLGKILDPLADKLMQCAALVSFYIKEIIPLWLLAAYIAKELLIGAGALFVFRKLSVVVKSCFWGKLAVCVFYASIAVLVLLKLYAAEPARSVCTVIVCAVMLCFALLALVQYFLKYINANKILVPGKENKA